ncbi:SRPBCC domain-containing protein [Streptomyces cupreus]|uniref:SRPBCC family protein n=1 Tax=Streptomyces cupreus TaxID=2759956 RepID=A0A7X1J8H3_9ACTN|nr:SRPBCC domain-containing protein [Streptomyces cupreus]MBC2903627.1 SRPBCC family protein [Streptomyces cupreus]
MELEVFVPVAAARLREALSDPARIARALPGLQQDAGADTPVSGRLRVRVGGHTITYRGALAVTPSEDGSYEVEGEAAEARGTGSVQLSLRLRVTDSEDGSTLTFEARAKADGRITQLPPEQVQSAVTRLLNRFAENLGAMEAEPGPTLPEPEETEAPEPAGADVEEAPQGPPAPEDESRTDSAGGNQSAEGEAGAPPEAAHARRTMIGRSAEEVDHAPPRGRYSPVPAPQPNQPASTLRWAAPAAALAVASAIVVSRVLRRRR